MSNSGSLIESERLLIRRLERSDAGFILALLNSRDWIEQIGDRGVTTLQQAETYLIQGTFRDYANHGYGLWLVALKDTHQPIGICGFNKRLQLDQPDLGFALLPAFFGFGYALEMATAAMVFAHDHLPFDRVFAITLPENKRSVRLLEKLGFHPQEKVSWANSEEILSLYGLSLSAWKAGLKSAPVSCT